MFKGLTRKGRINAALSDIQTNLGTAPIVFSGDVIDSFEEANAEIKLYSDPPLYKRMMIKDGSPHYCHFGEIAGRDPQPKARIGGRRDLGWSRRAPAAPPLTLLTRA